MTSRILAVALLTLALPGLPLAGGEAAGEAIEGTAPGGAEGGESLPMLPGSAGAITVPFEMPVDGIASVSLYNAEGAVVRPLAQLVELAKGRHGIRWDGMDHWGRFVPEGTELEVRVVANPGIRAYYEMAVDRHGGATAWGSHTGEGDERRQGGWLGDHSAPSTVAAIGDRVFIGCPLAEHGDNLIMCTLDGEKMRGRKLAGWAGPREMAAAGNCVYTTDRSGGLFRVDPDGFHVSGFGSVINGKALALAGHGDTTYVYARNPAKALSPFRHSGASIDFLRTIPEIKGGAAPTEFHLSAHAAARQTFTAGGRPEIGVKTRVGDLFAYLVLRFRNPTTLGSLLLERTGGERMDVWYLDEGVEYEEDLHRLDELLPEEMPADWVELGETDFPRRLEVLTTPDRPVETRAIMFRIWPPEGLARKKRPLPNVWKAPGIQTARILARRIDAVDPLPEIRLPEGRSDLPRDAMLTRPSGDAVRWDFHGEYDLTDVNPAQVILDYGEEQTFRGVVAFGSCNPNIYLERWIGPEYREPDNSDDENWETLGRIGDRHSRKLRSFAATVRSHERFLHFREPVTARYLRLRIPTGQLKGKHGAGFAGPDYKRTTMAEFRLLRTLDHIPEEDDEDASHVLEVHRLTALDPDRRGRHRYRAEAEELVADVAIQEMACASEGTLYTVINGRLSLTTIDGAKVSHRALDEKQYEGVISLAVDDRYVAMGQREVGVHLFDRDGKHLRTIGAGAREPGAWNSDWIEKPSGIAFDERGKLWVAEEKFSPKRVARFDLDAGCEWEAFGPPMYGGGGRLDPDLESFYYRGVEYALDWERGESRVEALNDIQYHDGTPTLELGSFSWTGVQNVRYHGGRRYIVGGGAGIVITIKPDESDAWKPAAVIAPAAKSRFLLGKHVWREHWAKKSLQDRWFIWCDRNDDGGYQIEEVEIFAPAEHGGVGGNILDDLTIRGSNRLRPHAFTPGGAPLYRAADIERIDHQHAATYSRMMSLGGPKSAKPHVGGSTVVTAEGVRYREGQPYAWGPDGGLIGGGLAEEEPSDYVPWIYGRRMKQPFKFVGQAKTGSEIGEVAVMNGNSGVWYVLSPIHRMVVGEVFTGRDGGWHMGPDEIRRGFETTGHKFRHETFGGDFTKARDGNYYAVGGKGFHAISRIEGLDDFVLRTSTIAVPEGTIALNRELRKWLKSRPGLDGRVPQPKSVEAREIDRVTKRFALDGDLRDWGGVAKMTVLGPLRNEDFFHVAHDEKGIYLCWSGWGHQKNHAEDLTEVFTTGFGLDFKYLAGKGDPRRLIFTPFKGEWTAVMYQYHDAEVMDEDMVSFESPLGMTKVARIHPLEPEEFRFAFVKHELGLDLASIDEQRGRSATGLEGVIAEMVEEEQYAVDHGSEEHFSAEAFVSWKALGFEEGRPRGLRCDVGILSADSGGTTVDRRTQWANRKTGHCSDVSIEAQLHPRSWGDFRFK